MTHIITGSAIVDLGTGFASIMAFAAFLNPKLREISILTSALTSYKDPKTVCIITQETLHIVTAITC